MTELDYSILANSDWYKLCSNSDEQLLKSLLLRLEEAWESLIANEEANNLSCEVSELINRYSSPSEPYPTLNQVKIQLLQVTPSDYFRQTVKWATVYAGLAAVAIRHSNHSEAWQLIASSTLVLLSVYRPLSEKAKNNHSARLGGDARSAKWKQVKDELAKLIEKEIRSHRRPFNSKKDAADYFATFLNEAAKKLKVKNSRPSMSGTIKSWFTTDKALRELINHLLSPEPKRKRSSV